MRSKFIGLIFAGVLSAGSGMAAEIVVKIAPPRVVVEKRGPAPGREYVWINGYHRWEGNSYHWEPGRWERPPHPRARWEQHPALSIQDGHASILGPNALPRHMAAGL